MKTRDLAIALAVALCAAALAACGGGDATGSGSRASDEEAALEFAACMRAHGVEVEDPKAGESLVIGDTADPATKKALGACDAKLGSLRQELSPEEGEEFKEGWLAFAKCMRGQGIDMGDPTFLGPGKVHLDIAGLDTSSPAFEAAREACEGKTPELSGGVTVGG